MTVYGLSQTNGVERILEVEKADTQLLLRVQDEADLPQERILVAPAAIVAALTDLAAGAKTVEGSSPRLGTRNLLDIEVRGNEVLLWVRPEAGGGWDIAIGLDDFQDAVEAAA